MKKLGIAAGVAAVAVGVALTAGSALAASPKAGGSCTKAGQKAKAGKTNLVCSKSGKKLVWTVVKATTTTKAATTTAASSAAGLSVKIEFTGQAQVKQSGSRIDIKADASGSGTGFSGSAHLTGEGQGDANAKPCPVFTGPGSIEAGGDKISFTVDQSKSSGCPDSDDNNKVIVTGTANVDGGSGKYAKAKGSMHFDGTFNRGDSSLDITFSGTLNG